jgi:hypothetical protein
MIPRPGPSLRQNTTARMPVTELCARTSVGRATPKGPQPRGTRHSGTPAHRGRHAHPGLEVERLPRGESRREPRVLWLWWHGPEGTTPDLDLLWRAYVRRFDLEHTLRFLKQSMGWTTPRVRHPEQADRWSWLIVAAYTQLRLARERVADLRLAVGTPLRSGEADACRGPPGGFVAFGGAGHASEKAPKPCGRSPGRPKGRLSGRAKRHPAVKRAA